APFPPWHGVHHEAGVVGEVAAEALNASQVRAPAGVEQLGELRALQAVDTEASATQVAGDLLATPTDLSLRLTAVTPTVATSTGATARAERPQAAETALAGARHYEVEAALEQRPPVRQSSQERDVVAAKLGPPVGARVREA